MQRYFISPEQMKDHTCTVEGSDAHHISKVMRQQINDKILCCNGLGRTVLAQIEHVDKEEVVCRILQEIDMKRELPISVTIAQGLPKGDKLEWVIQKGTELGAHCFIPFSSSRTIVKYDAKKEQKKVERWEKIAKEAAEQSHRDVLPKIEQVRTFKQLLQYEAKYKLVAYEEESIQLSDGKSSFYQALEKVNLGDQVVIVIGPEGGLEAEEVQQLKDVGFQPISLGKRILRTETASQYVLAAISFYYEQMGG
jgi:16S rRNA (uracil1498-N3)-methyltransferase